MTDFFNGVDLENINTGYLVQEGMRKVIKGTVVDNNVSKVLFGDSFFASYVTTGVANDGIVRIYIENPIGHDKNILILANFDVEGKAYFKSYRDFTLSNQGTVVNAVNLNFGTIGDGKTTDIIVKRNGVVSNQGTLRFDRLLPFGTGGNSTGGGSPQAVTSLGIGRSLLLEVQNKSGQPKDIGFSIKFDEYEIY